MMRLSFSGAQKSRRRRRKSSFRPATANMTRAEFILMYSGRPFELRNNQLHLFRFFFSLAEKVAAHRKRPGIYLEGASVSVESSERKFKFLRLEDSQPSSPHTAVCLLTLGSFFSPSFGSLLAESDVKWRFHMCFQLNSLKNLPRGAFSSILARRRRLVWGGSFLNHVIYVIHSYALECLKGRASPRMGSRGTCAKTLAWYIRTRRFIQRELSSNRRVLARKKLSR